MTVAATDRILVVGEAVVDVITTEGEPIRVPGGGPANTAVALAQLAAPSICSPRSDTTPTAHVLTGTLRAAISLIENSDLFRAVSESTCRKHAAILPATARSRR